MPNPSIIIILQKLRLIANSTLSRGCGGVGLMWKKDLDAVPISSISSNRIYGL